jgi:hypothetical protein
VTVGIHGHQEEETNKEERIKNEDAWLVNSRRRVLGRSTTSVAYHFGKAARTPN